MSKQRRAKAARRVARQLAEGAKLPPVAHMHTSRDPQKPNTIYLGKCERAVVKALKKRSEDAHRR